MFQVKYRRTRFPAWMESSVEERREWRKDSRQPIVPSWRVFRSFQPMPPYRCEFEKLLQSYTYVLPSHMSPVLPQKVFAAARRQFRFYHVNLSLVQTHSIIDCVGISCLCFATAYPRLSVGIRLRSNLSIAWWRLQLAFLTIFGTGSLTQHQTQSESLLFRQYLEYNPIGQTHRGQKPQGNHRLDRSTSNYFHILQQTKNALTNQLELLKMKIDSMSAK